MRIFASGWDIPICSLLAATLACFALCTSGQAQTFAVVHDFSGAATDGMYPTTSPILDAYGNLYGGSLGGDFGRGAGYKNKPDWDRVGAL